MSVSSKRASVAWSSERKKPSPTRRASPYFLLDLHTLLATPTAQLRVQGTQQEELAVVLVVVLLLWVGLRQWTLESRQKGAYE